MQKILARFNLWANFTVGFVFATTAIAFVVASARPTRARSSDSTSIPAVAGPATGRLNVTARRPTRRRIARFKLSVVMATFLAISTVAAGTMVALALSSGAGTPSAAPALSTSDQFAAGYASPVSRTPGQGSLNFALLATQTAAHRPTSTATPTPTPTATSTPTPTPTATPTPPPPFVWPGEGWISQPMSAKHPSGIDIAVNAGWPIYAVRAGRVGFAGGDPCCSYGYYIVVEHDDGWTSLYGHLNSFAVVAGTGVEQGQLIGLSGETGKAKGVHLHFELRTGGVPVDPLEYLPPR